MSFPRYSSYKDSGVEWLRAIPNHWNVLRFQRCVYVAEGQVDPEDSQFSGMFLIAPNHIESGTGRLLNLETAADQGAESGKYYCEADDVVYSKIRPALRKVCIAPEPCLCSADMYPLRAHSGLINRFLFWLILSEEFSTFAELESQRVAMPKINRESLKEVSFALPPTHEQTAIVNVLDRETSKIDDLVSEQQRLIGLLKEKRQAVISRVVTKGLNPDAPMKPSGIEWLGDVPEHWDVKPMRMIANVVRGASPRPAGDPRFFDGDAVPWVTVAEITKDSQIDLTETETFLTEEGAKLSSVFPAGTVIYSNSGATLGVPKILRIDACANDGVVAFENLSSNINPQFLYHYLASITDAIREKVKQGSGQPNLNTDIVKALRFAVPPFNEQDFIVGHIAELIAQFDSLASEAQRAIDLLQERRIALISAAVTGKIDIRGLAQTEAA